MACYLEIRQEGHLIIRRAVDPEKAARGCRIRLGAGGEVHLSTGQSATLGHYEVCLVEETEESTPLPELSTTGHSEGACSGGPSVPPQSFRITKPRHYPTIEGYEVTRRLGEGGMGTVWCALQLSTRRDVALKLLGPGVFGSEKARTRFEREVELTARLEHPNIARVYDSGLHQGVYYYAMELIDGVPLDRYVKDQRLSLRQVLELMRTVCQAVQHAHQRGVIHRDLKPSNILVTEDGQPHVLDFGLAKSFLEEEEALAVSIEGEIAGTPAYMIL